MGTDVRPAGRDRCQDGDRTGGFNIAALLAVLLYLAAPPAPAGENLRIAVLGDSLTAGYGLAAGQAFPARLEAALAAGGSTIRVINAGVSGDTTAGGLARLDWMLADGPDMVIVSLGANDGLRGLAPEQTAANLDAILARLEAEGVTVLLAGMLAPPNLGAAYGEAFRRIYPELAGRRGVALYPFFLAGVAGRPALNQADGIHPTAEGVEVMVRGILPFIKPLIQNRITSP